MAHIFFHTLFFCCMWKALSFKEIQNHFQALEFTLFHSRMSTQGQTSTQDRNLSSERTTHFVHFPAAVDRSGLTSPIHLSVSTLAQCPAQILREDNLSLEGLFSSQESWLARFYS